MLLTSSTSFFTTAMTTQIYTLSLHDALPIFYQHGGGTTWMPGTYDPQLNTLRIVGAGHPGDRKSTRLNSSHRTISYAVFCLKKKKTEDIKTRITEPAEMS